MGELGILFQFMAELYLDVVGVSGWLVDGEKFNVWIIELGHVEWVEGSIVSSSILK